MCYETFYRLFSYFSVINVFYSYKLGKHHNMSMTKTTSILLIFFVLASRSFGQTNTGVVIDSYDKNDSLLSSKKVDSHCAWSTNTDSTILIYNEYDSIDNMLNEIHFQIAGIRDDETTTTMYLEKDGIKFSATFWKNSALVAYTFSESHVLMSGEVKY
jgi:hypothetical protein